MDIFFEQGTRTINCMKVTPNDRLKVIKTGEKSYLRLSYIKDNKSFKASPTSQKLNISKSLALNGFKLWVHGTVSTSGIRYMVYAFFIFLSRLLLWLISW